MEALKHSKPARPIRAEPASNKTGWEPESDVSHVSLILQGDLGRSLASFRFRSLAILRPAHWKPPRFERTERMDSSCRSSSVKRTAEGSPQRDNAPAPDGALAYKCPDCCLAAHAGAAVLPERSAVLMRPPTETAATVHYYAGSARQPESLSFSAANGARASRPSDLRIARQGSRCAPRRSLIAGFRRFAASRLAKT